MSILIAISTETIGNLSSKFSYNFAHHCVIVKVYKGPMEKPCFPSKLRRIHTLPGSGCPTPGQYTVGITMSLPPCYHPFWPTQCLFVLLRHISRHRETGRIEEGKKEECGARMTEGRRWYMEEGKAECQDVAQQPLVFPRGRIIIQGKSTSTATQCAKTRSIQLHTTHIPDSTYPHVHSQKCSWKPGAPLYHGVFAFVISPHAPIELMQQDFLCPYHYQYLLSIFKSK